MPDFSAMASAFEKDLGKITMKVDLKELGNDCYINKQQIENGH
jgi:hypothetical protein